MRHGPRYGYFPDPGKSWYICKVEDEAVARQVFKANDLDIQFSRGQRYLGGFIGSNASKVDWLGSMVTTWVAAVETLRRLPTPGLPSVCKMSGNTCSA